jgi:hypothetical protein
MKETRYSVTWDFGLVKAGLLRSCQSRKSWINIKSTLYPDARTFAMTWRQFWYFIVVFRFSLTSHRRFSSSDECERVDELWSSDEGTSVNILYTQNIYNLFTRSHPSEDENRTRHRSRNCNCKQGFIDSDLTRCLALKDTFSNLCRTKPLLMKSFPYLDAKINNCKLPFCNNFKTKKYK